MWTAYLDESESMGAPPTYTLAAALVEQDTADELRAPMRALLRPGDRKVHWREESEKTRPAIMTIVACRRCT